ncbi:MAG: hypothetical protein NT040_00930 [Bacteroidetes bacterium]|nr:hypothetical protein [Bacteroidota bacterium]
MIKPGFLILLLVVSLTGCISEQKCQKRYPPVESTETVIQHDTVNTVKDSLILLPADSGLIRALLECREGKVVIRQIEEIRPGKKIIPFIDLKNNVLTTGAKIDSNSIYFAWKETHIRESKIQLKVIEKPVYKVTGFQNFLIWSGKIFWVILLLVIGVALIRAFIKKKLPI